MGYFTYPISMQVLSFVGLLERSALHLNENPQREMTETTEGDDKTYCGEVRRHFHYLPLCSFTCSFRCFLKLKDFPQAGSGQEKDF